MVGGENVGRRDGVEDYEQFQLLLESMDTMGFQKSEQTSIFSIISSILHLLNLTFLPINADECKVDTSSPHLDPTLALLGLTSAGAEILNKALTSFSIQIRGSMIQRKLNKQKAEKGLKALAKALYAALFDYIVQSVNRSIQFDPSSSSSSASSATPKGGGGPTRPPLSSRSTKKPLASKKKAAAFIGVLDIFGFESFAVNSFEQLCINYCNEALQQQFNRFVFKVEQLEYQREGIKWSFIEFPDNQDVLDLIDKKTTGIISLLDDQCKTPSTTDKTFATSLYKNCKPHPRFQASHRQVGLAKFSIQHYAGFVEYEVEGFMEKNKDEMPKEAADLLLGSDKSFVQNLARIMTQQSSSSPLGAVNRRGRSPTSPPSTRPTVGGQFASQLRLLREKIDTTAPHYIRCLKPNEELIPDDFDPAMIADQLRSAGVLEAVRVSRVGFPQRYTHFQFVKRYGCLAPQTVKKGKASRDVKKQCLGVVEKVALAIWKDTNPSLPHDQKMVVDPGDVGIQVGKTKVFLRQHVFEHLEKYRSRAIEKSCVRIQAVSRGYIHRREFQQTLKHVKMIQSLVRKMIGTQKVQGLREERAAGRMQTVWRRYEAQKNYGKKMEVMVWCQRMWRGRQGRALYRSLDEERRSIVIQKVWRMYYWFSTFLRQKRAVHVLQCFVRCCKAQYELKQLKLGARDLDAVKKELARVKAELAAAKLNQAPAAVLVSPLTGGREEDDSLKREYEEETRKSEEAAKQAGEVARQAEEEARKSEAAARQAEEEARLAEEEARKAKEELEEAKRAAAEEAEKSRLELERIKKEMEEAKRKHEEESQLLLTFPSPQPTVSSSTNDESVILATEEGAHLLEEVKRSKEEQEKAQAETLALKKELEDTRLSFLMEIKNARGESDALREKLSELSTSKTKMEASNENNDDEIEMFKAEIERLQDEIEMFKTEIECLQQELAEKEEETQRMEDIILDMADGESSYDDDSSESSSSDDSQLSGSVEEKNTRFWNTVDDIKRAKARAETDDYTAPMSDPSSTVSRGMSIQFDSASGPVGPITYDTGAADSLDELRNQIEVLRSELHSRNMQSESVQTLAAYSRQNMQEVQALREELRQLKKERE